MESAPLPLWRRLLGILGGLLLGAVLLIAAWAKALDPQAFARQIEIEGLDIVVGAGTVALIALALEVFLGGALILGLRRRWILWPTTALVAFFLFLTGRSYWRWSRGEEQEVGCGCFGNLVERTPAEAFWQDLLLMVPALLLAWWGLEAARHLPRFRLALVGLLTLAVVLFAWKAPELPLDNLATKLKPSTQIMEHCVGDEAAGTRMCMDAVLPELASGEHVVMLAEVTDPAFGERIEELNAYHWAGNGPTLWLLTDATDDELFQFRFSWGPAFEIREAPPALLAPLYRTLPRSFHARDGEVAATYSGLPPLEDLAAEG